MKCPWITNEINIWPNVLDIAFMVLLKSISKLENVQIESNQRYVAQIGNWKDIWFCIVDFSNNFPVKY